MKSLINGEAEPIKKSANWILSVFSFHNVTELDMLEETVKTSEIKLRLSFLLHLEEEKNSQRACLHEMLELI